MPPGDQVSPRALAQVLIRNHGSEAARYAEVLIQEMFQAGRLQTCAVLRDVLKAINDLDTHG